MGIQSWGDLASIIGIIGSLSGFIGWIVKKLVIDPLTQTMDKLTDGFKGLDKTLEEIKSNSNELDKRVDRLDIRVTKVETKTENVTSNGTFLMEE